MSRITLLVALLLIGLGFDAAAGDGLKKSAPSKKAQKINAYLEKIGLTSPEMKKFAQSVDQRIEGDYLRLAEQQYEVGRVVLFYELEPHISTRQFNLKFQPKDSNFEYTATTRSAMVNYNFAF